MGLIAERTSKAARGTKRPRSHELLFITEFIRRPLQIGALYQSPPWVARAMVSELGLERARAVVEYGPGAGPLTREILERVPPGCKFFAIEKNERLARVFRERHPTVRLFEDSAANVRRLCEQESMGPLDAVVTTIPWILFPREAQEQMFDETLAMLKPGGRFSMITYRTETAAPVRKLLELVRSKFCSVDRRVSVWSRMSPAYIYRATK